MRTLALTSPHMHGPDILALQWLLHQRGYYHDERDGDYGPLTAQAVYRAKFWLGYRKPDQQAAQLLVDYLKHSRKPTWAMRTRALARKRRQAEQPLRVRALAEAILHLGSKERTGHNDIFWTDWWHLQGPWCAMYASWCYLKAGSKTFSRGNRYAYCPYIVADARAGRNHLTVVTFPAPGDLVLYDWDKDGVADHVGLFENWIAGGEGTEFHAIEGNTAVGNDSNGGEVLRRTRKRNQVQVFAHVGR